MASLDQVMQALRAADAAGNVEDARKLAQIAARMRAEASSAPEPPAKPEKLSVKDDLIGGAKATLKGAVKGLAALPNMVADPLYEMAGFEAPSKGMSAALNRWVGETPSHGSVENLAAAGTSAMLPVGMAQRAAGPLAEALAAGPGAQLISAVSGEGARQGAESMGAGAIGQTAAALAGGVLGPMGVQALGDAAGGLGKKAYRAFLEPRLESGRQAIEERTLLDAAGDRASAMAEALRNYKPVVPGSVAPAGEVVAPFGRTEFAALQDSAEGVLPSAYYARGKERDAARLAQVRSVGQDEEALAAALKARAQRASKAYGAIEDTRIAPQADDALLADEIARTEAAKGAALQDAGRYDTMAAQQRTLGEGRVVGRPESNTGSVSETAYPREGLPPPEGPYRSEGMPGSAFPVPGQPRVPPRYTENLQRVPEAQAGAAAARDAYSARRLEESWLRDMRELMARQSDGASKIGLDDMVDRPSVRAALDDARQSALESGRSFPASTDDAFSVANLQDIKESLDRGIAAAQAAARAGRRPEVSAEKLTSTRDKFIAWLEYKSPEWGKARQQYREDSVPINQMRVGQFLEGKLTNALDEDAPQRAAAYAQALREAPATTVRKVTGTPRFEKLTDVLTPEQVKAVESVRDDLASMGEYRRMATAARSSEHKAGDAYTRSVDQTGKMHVPNLLSRPAMLANWVTKRLEANMDRKMAERIAQTLLDPGETGKVLERALKNRTVRDPAAARYARALRNSSLGTATGALPNVEED